MRAALAASLSVALLLVGSGAAVDAAAADRHSRPPSRLKGRLTPLTYHWTADGFVTGLGAASTFTLLLFGNDLAPLHCRWCGAGGMDGDIAQAVGWAKPHVANSLSNLMVAAIPVGVIGFGLIQAFRWGDSVAGLADLLVIGEATVLAMLANTIVKYATGRARPYVRQGNPALYPSAREANLSFFGGHTAFAFAVAVAGGTLFVMQDMPGAPYLLGAGLAAAAFTGYLRMAANQHYLTDVLVGAALGSLVGWAVPYLFHRPRRKGSPRAGHLLPAPGGIAIAW